MTVEYNHKHVFWLIEKTFNITETDGILTYIGELEAENERLHELMKKRMSHTYVMELEATIERLKVGGNCRHWEPGLLGCGMDSSQETVCEGPDKCKVFNQAVGGPREACWQRREGGE